MRNGTLWVVLEMRAGAVRVRRACAHEQAEAVVVLPREDVRDEVELGYATTTHRAQGITVTEAHVLASGAKSCGRLEPKSIFDFDRQLRMLVMEGVERIEVAVRMRTGYILGGSSIALTQSAVIDMRSSILLRSSARSRVKMGSW